MLHFGKLTSNSNVYNTSTLEEKRLFSSTLSYRFREVQLTSFTGTLGDGTIRNFATGITDTQRD